MNAISPYAVVRLQYENVVCEISVNGDDIRYGSDENSARRYLHYHTSYELFFVPEGRLVVRDSDGDREISRDSISIPPFYPHTTLHLTDARRLLITISKSSKACSVDIYARLRKMLDTPYASLPVGSDVHFYINRLHRCVGLRGRGFRKELEALGMLILLGLCEAAMGPGEENGPMGNEDFTVIIDDLINNHYREPLTLNDAAELLHLSPRHTARMISSCYGSTFRRLLLIKRIDVAKRMLLDTDAPILAISSDCGFRSVSHFYDSFREVTGYSPQSLRDDPPRDDDKEQA